MNDSQAARGSRLSFPARPQPLGGVGAGIGSLIFTLATGWVVTHFGDAPILTAAGGLAPAGTIVLLALTGRIRKLPSQIRNPGFEIGKTKTGVPMNNYFDLTGKVALVTGAGSGLGKATAIALATAGTPGYPEGLLETNRKNIGPRS